MRTVKEVSKLTGVSVRTLHHYDAIGLLKPAKVTEAGYRLYDDKALGRLQSILLFRQLQFSLKEIKEILDRPDFDIGAALEQQIKLLELQQAHIGRLIDHARKIQQGGEVMMDFQPFDKSEMESYKEEAKKKWGKTETYAEFAEREKNGEDFEEAGNMLMDLFADLGELRHLPAEAEAVQDKIAQLQAHITSHFYTCTDEILLGLGQMYTGDPRMKENIDKAGGPGTADFAAEVIEVYCRKRQG